MVTIFVSSVVVAMSLYAASLIMLMVGMRSNWSWEWFTRLARWAFHILVIGAAAMTISLLWIMVNYT